MLYIFVHSLESDRSIHAQPFTTASRSQEEGDGGGCVGGAARRCPEGLGRGTREGERAEAAVLTPLAQEQRRYERSPAWDMLRNVSRIHMLRTDDTEKAAEI